MDSNSRARVWIFHLTIYLSYYLSIYPANYLSILYPFNYLCKFLISGGFQFPGKGLCSQPTQDSSKYSDRNIRFLNTLKGVFHFEDLGQNLVIRSHHSISCNIYFWLRFCLANAINELVIPKIESDLFCILEIFKTYV